VVNLRDVTDRIEANKALKGKRCFAKIAGLIYSMRQNKDGSKLSLCKRCDKSDLWVRCRNRK
jgi:hypothetical protein